MSTSTAKRSHAEAIADARAFKSLFDGAYERWEFAGSIRRNRPEVSDVEHVVIPTIGDAGGLFPGASQTNLLMQRCDQLLGQGIISKHVYEVNYADGTTGTRSMWGDIYRGVSFAGSLHEIFSATADNWGSILAIRTGSAEFSEMLVTKIKSRGLCQRNGYVRYVSDGKIYVTRTEEAFFEACGVKWIPPERR